MGQKMNPPELLLEAEKALEMALAMLDKSECLHAAALTSAALDLIKNDITFRIGSSSSVNIGRVKEYGSYDLGSALP